MPRRRLTSLATRSKDNVILLVVVVYVRIYFIILDAAMMVIASTLFNVGHPSWFLRKDAVSDDNDEPEELVEMKSRPVV
ncbi:hypothetical protein BBP40_004124 [Aspergillus hancockii]|nr:hypothetical protein BBP40_004124 [Aspergillus hancockii]